MKKLKYKQISLLDSIQEIENERSLSVTEEPVGEDCATRSHRKDSLKELSIKLRTNPEFLNQLKNLC